MRGSYKLIIFAFFFITLILFVSYVIGKRAFYYESGLPGNRCDIVPVAPAYVTYKVNIKAANLNAVNLFKVLPHSVTDIVLLGTSLTQGFPLQEMFLDCRLKNRGIGGNTTEDILNRLSEVTNGKPAKIFLEMGTNDLGKDSINVISTNLIKIINSIKSETPLTKIYVQSVLPSTPAFTLKVKAYNKKVEQYCDSHKIPFINLYPLFIGKNQIRKELTTDGTHLTAQGYLLWRDALSPYLKN